MENYISIKNLSKNYGQVEALKHVDLEIPKGKIVGLMGKNGAGKSTLLKSMLGMLKYEGDVCMLGKNIYEWKHELYGRVAFIPDVSGLDPRLTVQETIDFTAAVNESWNWDKSKRLFAESELPCDQKVGTLSKGMKTKLYLLLTLSKDVDILLLDEPTLGLDIVFRKEFYDLLLGEFYNEDKTVIISTHQVAEVENILHDVVFIDKGRVLLNSSVEDLKNKWHIYEVPLDQENIVKAYHPSMMTKSLGYYRVLLKGKMDIEGVKSSVPGLSDIFIALTQGERE